MTKRDRSLWPVRYAAAIALMAPVAARPSRRMRRRRCAPTRRKSPNCSGRPRLRSTIRSRCSPSCSASCRSACRSIPTENYYYFRFVHNGVRLLRQHPAGGHRSRPGSSSASPTANCRADWNRDPKVHAHAAGAAQGVSVEKVAARSTTGSRFGDKSVTFALNDLSESQAAAGIAECQASD